MSKLSVLPRRSLFCADVVANNVELVANVVANDTQMIANGMSRHGKYADLNKRREYMRKYMSEYRANK